MDAWKTIDRIGMRLGVRSGLRGQWRQQGVPVKWHLRIVAEAKRDGIVLDLAALRRRLVRPKRHKRAL
jgi:hypothetical protein